MVVRCAKVQTRFLKGAKSGMKFAASANLYFGYSYFYFYFAKVKAICDAQQRKSASSSGFSPFKANKASDF